MKKTIVEFTMTMNGAITIIDAYHLLDTFLVKYLSLHTTGPFIIDFAPAVELPIFIDGFHLQGRRQTMLRLHIFPIMPVKLICSVFLTFDIITETIGANLGITDLLW